MKSGISVLIIIVFFQVSLMSQMKDTIVYDPITRNYEVRYTTILFFAKSENGSIRKLEYGDLLQPNEVLVEKDTFITAIFVPGTKIEPVINCRVRFNKDSNAYYYEYVIENKSNAEQELDYFILNFGKNVDIKSNTENMWRNQQRYKTGTNKLDNKWSWSGGSEITPIKEIKPGEKLGGFGLISNALPGIFTAYFQGKTKGLRDFEYSVSYSPISWQIMDLEYGEDSFVKRLAVAPSGVLYEISTTFGLDSLKSYTTQSRSLGWVKDDATANKYLGYFTSAKNNLQQNNIRSTRTILQQVLQDVNIDSTSHLTSEAYALIRYNTEYLLEQLPALPSLPSVPELLDTLTAHLQICYSNGWLGNRQFKELLEKNIQSAKNKYQKKDSIGCAQELEELQQTIRIEYLSKPTRNDRRYINAEAYRLLTSDISNIISNILTLPPRTSGTIYEQITALQTELKRAETENQIGGKILTPALNLLLETAKKQIQKQDTIKAALEIRLFQITIQEVYEITQKLKQKKDRPFITATAYISLYYRAKYILEQITDVSAKALPKLESGLEKELQEMRKEVVE